MIDASHGILASVETSTSKSHSEMSLELICVNFGLNFPFDPVDWEFNFEMMFLN